MTKPPMPFPKALTFERLRVYVVTLVGLVCLGNCGMTAAMAYVAVGMAVRPIPVIVRDADGRALVVPETSIPGTERPEPWRHHFVKTFIRRFVALDSATLEEDLAEALNMMAPDWRDYLLADGQRLDKRRRFSVGTANIKARTDDALVVRVSESTTEPKSYFAAAYGAMHFLPRLASLQPNESIEEKVLWFYTWMQFRPSRLTEINPYGYEITAEETRWFDSSDLLEAHLDLENRR